MKNSDVKTARKSAATDIEISLNAALKKVAAKLGQNSERFTKKIEKNTKRLAKKLSKEMEFPELELLETSKATNGVEKHQASPKSEEKPQATAKAAPEPKGNPAKSKTASKPVAKDTKPV